MMLRMPVTLFLSLVLASGCLPDNQTVQPAAIPFPSAAPQLGASLPPTSLPSPSAVPDEADFVPTSDVDYDDPQSWVNHPFLVPDGLGSSMNYTVFEPGGTLGSQGSVPISQGGDRDVFFIYPTGKEEGFPLNVALRDQDEALLKQQALAYAGQFAEFGRIFVPKYRYATRETFRTSDSVSQAIRLEKAAYDVMAAFQHYMGFHNKGRKVVLVGHEQGSLMLAMLLRKMVDRHRWVRDKIELVVLGGMGGAFMPPFISQGQAAGGWWEVVPVCQTDTDTGCILAWQVWKEGLEPPAPAATSVVNNALLQTKGFFFRNWDETKDEVAFASLGFGAAATLAGLTLFPADVCEGCVSTPFVAYEDFFQARYQKLNTQQAAIFIQRRYAAEESRINPMLEEEKASDFSEVGYPQYGFQAVLGRVLENVRRRLAANP